MLRGWTENDLFPLATGKMFKKKTEEILAEDVGKINANKKIKNKCSSKKWMSR